jgi:outer membrane protein OmpA-like peptidoglycan-associated protein
MKQIYPKKIKNYSFSNSKQIAQSNICLLDQSIELQKYQSKNIKTDFLLANHNTNQFYMKDFLSTSTMRSLISLFKVSSQKFQSAAIELQKIADIMKEYPQMRIDVRSHTDSRKPAQYNQKLSQERADATRAWLIKKGIAPSRLTATGYGESKLVNECADGIKCSEEQHQANRRSEFIIID